MARNNPPAPAARALPNRALPTRARPTRPPDARRQLRADATRQRIIDETVACIIEEGYAASSARNIARRADLTWGVVQYHFGNREGILAAVVEAGLDQLVEAIQSAEVPSGPARARIEALVESAWRAYTTPLSRAGLEILIATRSSREEWLGDRLEPFGAEVARLARSVAPASPAAGRVLFLAIRGLALDQLHFPGEIDSTRDRAAIVDAVLGMIDTA